MTGGKVGSRPQAGPQDRAAPARGAAGSMAFGMLEGARQAWARRDPLAIGFAVSLVFHLAVMMVRFAPPDPIRFIPSESQLEVVLVNAKTKDAPVAPEVLAQVNMEGGGDRDSGRARSPLPAESKAEDGEALQAQQARVRQLEEQQRQLLAMAQGEHPAPQAPPVPREESPAEEPNADETKTQIARLQAQIDRQIEDYNKRPRRLTYGVNAVGVNYARYVDAWADTIERIGTDRFPKEARGRMYDSLIITVEIDRFGNVVDVLVNKKSKYEALNRVIKQIVYAGAPYAPFTDEMRKDGDILQIVRTWTFTNNSLKTSVAK
jgi:periplasmic protein TonB